MSNKGLVHIYCGDGKGKTTAAVGLAVRCAGGGGKVLFFQFMKGNNSGERVAMNQIAGIELVSGAEKMKFVWDMSDEEKQKLAKYYNLKLEELEIKAYNGRYDMLVLDEIMSAISCGFVDLEKICTFIENKPEGLEIVMTGREPDERLIKTADYVSEIKKIKHPFDKNISARKFIEF